MSGRRSDSSLAALLLAQRLVDNPAEALRASEFWAVLDAVSDPGRLLGLDAATVAATGVADELAERVARRLESATALAFELERLEQSGLQILSSLDDGYPHRLVERLGRGAPPILHVAGSIDLLADDGIGVVGSRNVSPEALEVTRDVAREAAARGCPLVSGAARGVDSEAMAAALEAGGRAVGVLADALARQVRDTTARRAILDEQLCMCTPYKPTAGFSVANAMGRNRIVYGLTATTLVVTSDEGKGGTWAGAVEALRGRITDVAVWDGPGAGAGNRTLAAKGARPVATVPDLFTIPPPTSAAGPGPGREQLSLDL